ncbi:transcription factor E2F7-like [Uloborus diversus]|uniref:transcription factor E2F7-like n=1 Tax=Uloborus diversus TaxID=327109 RepID=UPI002409269F|nr:transcription factor E2F7-like [Uloborus diversus]
MYSIKRKQSVIGPFCSSPKRKDFCIDAGKENIPPEALNNGAELLKETSFDSKINCPKDTPKKLKKSADEPVTPNTNFKLLTSLAATLDYANCSTPKSRRTEEKENASFDSEALDQSSFIKPNRKEKSLSVICSKFFSMYPLYPESDAKLIVSLDEACLKLSVERRRLYDIVNVFESIGILTKNAKNQYLWFGKRNMIKSLYELKARALEEKIAEKLQYVFDTERKNTLKQKCILNEVTDFNLSFENLMQSAGTDLLDTSPYPEMRKEKSLGIMSQKFLMLFLISPSKVISLGVAAKVLNGFSQRTVKSAQVKTQIRRLYDIANVFTSIGLIQKEVAHADFGKKPAFKYTGPELKDGLENTGFERQSLSRLNANGHTARRTLARHSSFQEICAVAEIEHQKLNIENTPNSAPPFDKNLNPANSSLGKRSFSDIKLENFDIKEELPESNLKQSEHPLKPLTTQPVQNFKVLNLPKPSTSTSTGSFYIMNNFAGSAPVALSSVSTVPTFLLLKNVASLFPKKQPEGKMAIESKSEKYEDSNTMELSMEQRNTILKYLNISLSEGQTATIQLEENSESTDSERKARNILKITNKISASTIKEKLKRTPPEAISSRESSVPPDFSEASSVCSTRNNSPSTVPSNESPLSIPSGYVTPIPSATVDMSFPSNIEVHDILKKIESQPQPSASNLKSRPLISKLAGSNSLKFGHFSPSDSNQNSTIQLNFDSKPISQGMNVSQGSKFRTILPKETVLHSSDSFSNDSLNLEVSDILKYGGESIQKHKPFLIDEKTLLSPIKKPQPLQKFSMSPLNTPSYHAPETVFVFNSPDNDGTTAVPREEGGEKLNVLTAIEKRIPVEQLLPKARG